MKRVCTRKLPSVGSEPFRRSPIARAAIVALRLSRLFAARLSKWPLWAMGSASRLKPCGAYIFLPLLALPAASVGFSARFARSKCRPRAAGSAYRLHPFGAQLTPASRTTSPVMTDCRAPAGRSAAKALQSVIFGEPFGDLAGGKLPSVGRRSHNYGGVPHDQRSQRRRESDHHRKPKSRKPTPYFA